LEIPGKGTRGGEVMKNTSHRSTALLDVEEGKALVTGISGGEELKGYLKELGIEEGVEMSVMEHVPERSVVVKVYARAVKLDPELASRLLVDDEGDVIQLNNLERGRTAALVKVLGGRIAPQRIPGLDLIPGVRFTMVGAGRQTPGDNEGYLVKTKVKDRVVTIGHETAQRILVD
jgi:Fe2+ transport system protein FeoA